MASMLIVEHRRPTTEEIARHRLVIMTDKTGQAIVVKNNLGLEVHRGR